MQSSMVASALSYVRPGKEVRVMCGEVQMLKTSSQGDHEATSRWLQGSKVQGIFNISGGDGIPRGG